jgi:hypothetical protein
VLTNAMLLEGLALLKSRHAPPDARRFSATWKAFLATWTFLQRNLIQSRKKRSSAYHFGERSKLFNPGDGVPCLAFSRAVGSSTCSYLHRNTTHHNSPQSLPMPINLWIETFPMQNTFQLTQSHRAPSQAIQVP